VNKDGMISEKEAGILNDNGVKINGVFVFAVVSSVKLLESQALSMCDVHKVTLFLTFLKELPP
jgi:hypothetical protein